MLTSRVTYQKNFWSWHRKYRAFSDGHSVDYRVISDGIMDILIACGSISSKSLFVAQSTSVQIMQSFLSNTVQFYASLILGCWPIILYRGGFFFLVLRADEELVDPKKYLEESCKPKCVKPLLEYQVCWKIFDIGT